MLDLRRNRVDYTGGLLSPPDGYHLERAVATTYSLDLETLLAVLLPLAIVCDAPDDPEAFANGPLLLRALGRMAPRLTVFHQAGQIPVPRRSTPLHALLDRILVPVCRDTTVHSFHPKTWTLEFRNADGNPLYRFLVLSRNLSRDDSLDIAFALESGSARKGAHRTRPLLDFLGFLGKCIPKDLPHAREHTKRLADLSRGLAAHPLALGTDGPWTDFDLFPLYNDASRRAFVADPLFTGHPGRVVVMSPFLSASVVRRLAACTDSPPVLLTRPDAFANLGTDIQNTVEAWALKDVVASPECVDTDARRDTDLHAKIYLRESATETALLLGSVNATESGMNRNVEFAVRLSASPRDYGRRKLLGNLFGPNPDAPTNPFERLCPGVVPDPDDAAQQADREAAQTAIDAFCKCNTTGRIEPDAPFHAIVVDVPSAFSKPPRVRRCLLRPLAFRDDRAKPAKGTLRFDGLYMADLSPLFVLAAETATGKVARVVRIPLAGLDENARDAAAIQAVVEASGGWAACLEVFFSLDPYPASAETLERKSEGAPNGGAVRRTTSGLYENMLRTAAEPYGAERFAEMDIDALLARQTGPEATRARELLALFRQALPRKRSPK